MKLELHQVPAVRGNVRMPFLDPEAALALVALEKDTDGLIYKDMWRDPTASLLVRRTNKASPLPGYSTHNYGLGIDLDVTAILQEKKIRYEDLVRILKKRGWVCYRRDGEPDRHGSEHFNYLGPDAEKYLGRVSMDPGTWQLAGELRIWEKYSKEFQIDCGQVQSLLHKMCLYSGSFTKQNDPYTREAILAFQRAWDLVQTGMPDISTCRVLVYVAAERALGQIPAWAV